MNSASTSSPARAFFQRKDIEISFQRYVIDALSAMALGLFGSLLIGLIVKTAAQQMCRIDGVDEKSTVVAVLVAIGAAAMDMMGPAIGVAVARALKAPPLVLFTSAAVGYMGATFKAFGIAQAGGPAGAFLAVCVGVEFGKMVSKETKVDILVTPAVTLLMGGLTAKLAGPLVGWLLVGLGDACMTATEWQPFWFGIFLAVVIGLALTAPISSAAICIMMELSGLAAGAATVGCCAQMVGFAVMSFRENGVGGLVAQGIGTSMIQISNIVRNPWVLLPPTLAGAVLGPISTCIFHMTNNFAGAGMGTSGLVGPLMTLTDMGFTLPVLLEVLLLQIALPAVLTLLFAWPLRRLGRIRTGDLRLEL
ncbi:MAG: PTS transporter subunit IIC [Anaerovoracaceae bacterium]